MKKEKIILLALCTAVLVFFAGCAKYSYLGSDGTAEKTEELVFLQSVSVVGDFHYCTDSVGSGSTVQTVLSRVNAKEEKQEITRFSAMVRVEYSENSFQASGEQYVYFSVHKENDIGELYSYQVDSNEFKCVVEYPCTNMVVISEDSLTGWVLSSEMLVAVDLAKGEINQEKTKSVKEIDKDGIFPNGFFDDNGNMQTAFLMIDENGDVQIKIGKGIAGNVTYENYKINMERDMIEKIET